MSQTQLTNISSDPTAKTPKDAAQFHPPPAFSSFPSLSQPPSHLPTHTKTSTARKIWKWYISPSVIVPLHGKTHSGSELWQHLQKLSPRASLWALSPALPDRGRDVIWSLQCTQLPSIYCEEEMQAAAIQVEPKPTRMQRSISTLLNRFIELLPTVAHMLLEGCLLSYTISQTGGIPSALPCPELSLPSLPASLPIRQLSFFFLTSFPPLWTLVLETFWKLLCNNQVLMSDNYLESLETWSDYLPLLRSLKLINKYLWKK